MEGAPSAAPTEEIWVTEPGGDQYKGPRNEQGQAHGYGALRFKNGEFYEGQFYNDRMDGVGKHRWPSGALYEGQWDADERQGLGVYTFADGSVYEGRFRKSLRESVRGVYRWKNGEVFEGGFKGDHLDGQGTFIWSSGRMDLNTYVKGVAKGEGVRWSEDRKQAWKLKDGVEGAPTDLEAANASLAAFEQACAAKLEQERIAAEKAAAAKAAALEKASKAKAKKK